MAQRIAYPTTFDEAVHLTTSILNSSLNPHFEPDLFLQCSEPSHCGARHLEKI